MKISKVLSCQSWKKKSFWNIVSFLFFVFFILEFSLKYNTIQPFFAVIGPICHSNSSCLFNVRFSFSVIIFTLIPFFFLYLKSFILSLKNLNRINHIYLKVHVWQLPYLDNLCSYHNHFFFYFFSSHFFVFLHVFVNW